MSCSHLPPHSRFGIGDDRIRYGMPLLSYVDCQKNVKGCKETMAARGMWMTRRYLTPDDKKSGCKSRYGECGAYFRVSTDFNG